MKEQWSAGVYQDSNLCMYCYTHSTNEVSPVYGIFHYFFKEEQKRQTYFGSINSRSNAGLRHLLYIFKGDGQYAEAKAFLLYPLSYPGFLQRPDSNRRPEVSHIYGTLNIFIKKSNKQHATVCHCKRSIAYLRHLLFLRVTGNEYLAYHVLWPLSYFGLHPKAGFEPATPCLNRSITHLRHLKYFNFL